MPNLTSYHLVWLSAHPQRSAEWLKAHIADGFQVHHVNGDHTNESPDNLVLIDGNDHLAIVHAKPALRVHRLVDHSRKGGKNSRKYMTKKMARRLARKANRARWHKPKLCEVKDA